VVLHCSSASDRAALPLYVKALREKGYEPNLLSTMQPKPTEVDAKGYVLFAKSPPAEIERPRVRRELPGYRRALALLDADDRIER
ncbi:MAG: hypothetical protein LC737_05965, partial [Chloroflexi bacterium]|nr:hypothetical protein [Chloroflexota bacterium]